MRRAHVAPSWGYPHQDLYVRDGRILDPQRLFYEERRAADVLIDCGGLILAPGFIDLQLNGAIGVDFSSDAPDTLAADLDKVGSLLLAHGVIAYCPTVVTSTASVYPRILERIRPRRATPHAAGVLGVHLEGPFLSIDKRGAHQQQLIRASLEGGMASLEKVYGSDLSGVRIITLAPELTGALPVVKQLVARGIVVSAGHSMANIEQAEAAAQCGVSLVTHLFNAMIPFHHRDPGIVGLLASSNTGGHLVYFSVIVDGIHTHPAAVRIAHRVNPEGLILITDAIAAMGLPEGVYKLGPSMVEITGKHAYIAGTTTLAGSIACLDECVRLFHAFTGCSLEAALEVASLHPARAARVDRDLGALEPGLYADFILLDDALNVRATFIGGERAWLASAAH